MTREKRYLDMMNQWMILNYEKKGIAGYLKQKGYHTIAIYGIAIYGRHVIRELEGSDIVIAYGIDQKKMKSYKDIKIIQPALELPYADIIINTVIHDHKTIQSILNEITKIPLVSLEDVIFDAYN